MDDGYADCVKRLKRTQTVGSGRWIVTLALDRSDISRMFLSGARLLRERMDALSDIDSRFGDGDHGVTMGKIAGCFESAVAGWDEATSIHGFLADLGDDIMAVGGGSAGPLYGTMIGGMADGISDDATTVDVSTMRSMLHASLGAMEDISTAKEGDKTMMDALIPAVRAADAAESDVEAALQAAARAAAEGARSTEHMVSKFGRARSYGEQTLGTPDAGAMSTSIIFEGFASAEASSASAAPHHASAGFASADAHPTSASSPSA